MLFFARTICFFYHRKFLQQHTAVLGPLTTASSAAISMVTKSSNSGLQQWLLQLVEEVSLSFGEQVRALIDTVKQMDSTLQRRSKLQPTSASASSSSSATANMTDSEKISLQVSLDVEAYGKEILSLGLTQADLSNVAAYTALKELTVETA